MPRLVLVIAVMLAVATAGGCGGSDDASDATTTDDTTTVTQTSTDTQTTTTDQPSAASWTEFGATVDDWNSAHEPDPKYPAEGCCYLPGPNSAGGRYAALSSNEYKGTARVDSFSIFWDDESIPLALARKVVRKTAPPGSRLTFTVRKQVCMMIEYRSPALTRAFAYKGAVMLAALYSSADQPFNGTVNDIEFLPVGGKSLDC